MGIPETPSEPSAPRVRSGRGSKALRGGWGQALGGPGRPVGQEDGPLIRRQRMASGLGTAPLSPEQTVLFLRADDVLLE